MRIVDSLCLENFSPKKTNVEMNQKLRVMLEGIKNGLLKLEIESKNKTIICKEVLLHGGPVWMLRVL